MPIDNTTLLKHTPTPPPERHRPWWVAPLVFFIGAGIMSGAAAIAFRDVAITRVVGIALVLIAGLWWLWRLYVGWQENGLLGLFYRDQHDMGSMLAGDEERDGLVIALWLLSMLAAILAVVLYAVAPAAIPGKLFG